MKQIISKAANLVVAASATLLIAGCGEKPDATRNTTTPPPAETSANGGSPASDLAKSTAAPSGTAPSQPPTPAKPGGSPGQSPDFMENPDLAAQQRAAVAAEVAARMKAGEEGLTPDPDEDPGLNMLQTAASSYYNAMKKPPASLEALVQARYLRAIPRAPTGKKYVLDPSTGDITIQNAK